MSLGDLVRARRLKYDVELCYLRGEEPTALELMEAPRMDEWTIHILDEHAEMIGIVSDERHQTSRLIWLDRHFAWARTEERLHRLGQRGGAT